MADPTLLEKAGYRRHFGRGIWINPKTKKIFSQEYIEDSDEKRIAAEMAAPSEGDWVFYFTGAPEERIKGEILAELGVSQRQR